MVNKIIIVHFLCQRGGYCMYDFYSITEKTAYYNMQRIDVFRKVY